MAGKAVRDDVDALEVYAGFCENADWNAGRVIDAVAEMGELDNTVVIYIYGDNGLREVPIGQRRGEGMAFMDEEAMELYNAVRHDQPMLHDGRWGMATAEVQWAILESARQRKEIPLSHQVAVPHGY